MTNCLACLHLPGTKYIRPSLLALRFRFFFRPPPLPSLPIPSLSIPPQSSCRSPPTSLQVFLPGVRSPITPRPLPQLLQQRLRLERRFLHRLPQCTALLPSVLCCLQQPLLQHPPCLPSVVGCLQHLLCSRLRQERRFLQRLPCRTPSNTAQCSSTSAVWTSPRGSVRNRPPASTPATITFVQTLLATAALMEVWVSSIGVESTPTRSVTAASKHHARSSAASNQTPPTSSTPSTPVSQSVRIPPILNVSKGAPQVPVPRATTTQTFVAVSTSPTTLMTVTHFLPLEGRIFYHGSGVVAGAAFCQRSGVWGAFAWTVSGLLLSRAYLCMDGFGSALTVDFYVRMACSSTEAEVDTLPSSGKQ